MFKNPFFLFAMLVIGSIAIASKVLGYSKESRYVGASRNIYYH